MNSLLPSIDGFYATVPVFDGFNRLVDAALYRPLPEAWLIGLADITNSTEAIAAGGYKSVNMAGASVITAVANAIGTPDFPFVFGGDGASFALPPDCAARARDALAASIAYVRDELALVLRAAMLRVSTVREHGLDVRIARFAPSAHVSYAMFSGGGVAWAEKQMKQGAFAVEPAPAGTRPDLTGLSCRFESVPSSRGAIVSILVVPAQGNATPEFWRLLETLLDLVADTKEAGRPILRDSLKVKWPPSGLELEARARHRAGRPLWVDRLSVAARSLLSAALFRSGLPLGRFRPAVYLSELIENSDFRKYDDGLRMTLDCSRDLATAIEALLVDSARRGVARYGLHQQRDALVTCYTPTVFGKHFHFVDGAAGGYAMAAANLAR
jgi:plasmid stabilization system protein ParE